MKSKIILIILVLVLCIGLLPATALAVEDLADVNILEAGLTEPLTPQYGPNGKFLAPIEAPAAGSIPISNRAQLEAIKNNLSGTYHLIRDIDLAGAEWVPIGDGGFIAEGKFMGTFDGQGHVIRNMKITGEGYEANGLFGAASDATIKNVGMEDTYINITRSSSVSAGGICGNINGFGSIGIINCYNTGTVSVSISNTGANVGGICGYTFGGLRISNCYNTGSVTSSASDTARAGGICGNGENIINCYNTGTVSSFATPSIPNSAYAGGICAFGGRISNCYNTGAVSSSSSSVSVGGIIGFATNIISNCYNTGAASVSTSDYIPYYAYVGGICGISHNSISNCYNIGTVSVPVSSSRIYVGGIIGQSYSNTSNCYCLNLYGSKWGAQLTSDQMKNAANFVGFDFIDIWDISSSVNNGYPYFRDRSIPFTDVAPGAWYYDAVKYVYGSGLMVGTSDTKFEPNATLTRAMVATVLYRMADEPDDVVYSDRFDDVTENMWYSIPISWASENEIVEGYGGSIFGTYDPITREQLATMLYRFAGAEPLEYDLSDYKDAESIHDWAENAMSWAVGIGLINGYEDSTLRPGGTATRAECAAILQRYSTYFPK